MNLHTHVRKALVALALVASLGLGSGAAYAAPADTAKIGATQSVTTDAAVAAASWVVYDGNHITSSLRCQSRITSLKKNYPNDVFMCKKVTIPACPTSITYWLVMIDEYRRTSAAIETSTLPESGAVALAC